MLPPSSKHCGGSSYRWLKLRGVNYRAEAFLSGGVLEAVGGSYPGMFHRITYPLPAELDDDSESPARVLGVLVHPPDVPGIPNVGQGGNHGIASNAAVMQSAAGWDWVAAAPDRNTGLWDRVTLEHTGAITLDSPHFRTTSIEFDDSGGNKTGGHRLGATAQLRMEVLASNASPIAAKGLLRLVVWPYTKDSGADNTTDSALEWSRHFAVPGNASNMRWVLPLLCSHLCPATSALFLMPPHLAVPLSLIMQGLFSPGSGSNDRASGGHIRKGSHIYTTPESPSTRPGYRTHHQQKQH